MISWMHWKWKKLSEYQANRTADITDLALFFNLNNHKSVDEIYVINLISCETLLTI
jgi:hypothetical protein